MRTLLAFKVVDHPRGHFHGVTLYPRYVVLWGREFVCQTCVGYFEGVLLPAMFAVLWGVSLSAKFVVICPSSVGYTEAVQLFCITLECEIVRQVCDNMSVQFVQL